MYRIKLLGDGCMMQICIPDDHGKHHVVPHNTMDSYRWAWNRAEWMPQDWHRVLFMDKAIPHVQQGGGGVIFWDDIIWGHCTSLMDIKGNLTALWCRNDILQAIMGLYHQHLVTISSWWMITRMFIMLFSWTRSFNVLGSPEWSGLSVSRTWTQSNMCGIDWNELYFDIYNEQVLCATYAESPLKSGIIWTRAGLIILSMVCHDGFKTASE